jgi:hypothetical protein
MQTPAKGSTTKGNRSSNSSSNNNSNSNSTININSNININSDSSLDVVDASLRVLNTTGLRVADCSVFPRIPSGPTAAAAMAVGRRAAELILEQAETDTDTVAAADTAAAVAVASVSSFQ